MKNIIKSILYYCGYYHISYLIRKTKEKKLLVLMYHDLAEEDEVSDRNIVVREKPARRQFSAHLRALKKSYRVISLEQAVREIKETGDLRCDSVSITFDDGYASVYKIAFPVLRKLGLSATVYLTTDWINGKMELWWEELANMVNKCDFARVDFAETERELGIELTSGLRQLGLNSKSRTDYLAKIEAELREKNDDEISRVVAKLKTLMFGKDYPVIDGVSALTWNEIREMANHGINFGSHTCSHLNLKYADSVKIEEEIAESKHDIEKQLGRKIQGFAYPYGTDLTTYASVATILKKHGFEYACTACWGTNSELSNLLLLRRATLPLTASRPILGRALLQDFTAGTENPAG